MRSAWHVHKNIRCGVCGVLLWPQMTCAMRGSPKKCPIPKLARCKEHWRSGDHVTTPEST